jgi:hypothetical protein
LIVANGFGQDPPGRSAGDLPIEQATKFDFVVNVKSAKALVITA